MVWMQIKLFGKVIHRRQKSPLGGNKRVESFLCFFFVFFLCFFMCFFVVVLMCVIFSLKQSKYCTDNSWSVSSLN